MTIGYPGKKSAEEDKSQRYKSAKNKSRKNKRPPKSANATNKSEHLTHAETEGNARHERKDLTSPLIFVSGITNLQQNEQVIIRLNYILKIVNNDTIKIMTKNGLSQNSLH
jgi:ATP-dependent 26S proteasome regulatory subunit